MFSSALVSEFVCWRDSAKTAVEISVKFGGKVEDGRRKKLPDPGGNLDCVTSGSALLRLSFYVHIMDCATVR